MSEHEMRLGAELEQLTEWKGEETSLWRAAIEGAKQEPSRHFVWLRPRVLGPLSLAACLLVAISIAWQSSAPRGLSGGTPHSAAPAETAARTALSSSDAGPSSTLFKDSHADLLGSGVVDLSDGARPAARTVNAQREAAPVLSTAGRMIVRQASMTMEVSDVRSAFNVVGGLIDGLAGEFVESAAVTGEGGSTRASIVLRVAAERLDSVMRSVRELGASVNEQLNASDVTDRITDLESQIRNERRIEVEMLELLSARTDAPLGDVLRIRESLGSVRLSIERLEAQRAGMAKQVTLSLLRIELNTKSVLPEHEPTEGAAFLGSLRRAFERGGTALGASVVWLVEALVGGLLVWTVVLVVGTWLVRSLRWRMTWA